MKNTKVPIVLDRERFLEFTWEAIDYITEKYESLGEALLLASAIDGNPMKMSKKAVKAVIDLLTALLITDDPEITPETVKKIMPLKDMVDYSDLIARAIKMGEDEAPKNV